ncbi:MAG: hypothetical protein RMK29_03220 [Myxococcales bacterium]|nr:hypothetical protein [Myxococcota bacterium]MDW8280695.1 hypothetical protein [Myxococcales bacterium]
MSRSAALALSVLICSCAASPGQGGQEESGCNTRISGVVTAPNGIDPIPGARVFLPRSTPPPLPPEIRCEPCGPGDEGVEVLARAESGPDGRFLLQRLPEVVPGGSLTIYIQKGRWRRHLEVRVRPCRETQLGPGEARLPRHRGEGDMPSMAVAVGDFDAIECVLQHIGVDAREFTSPNEAGAVHLYENEQRRLGGAPGGVPVDRLLLDPRALRRYHIVLLNCTDVGGIEPYVRDALVQRNLLDYVSQGGRLYTTDWTYNFIAQQPEWAPFLCFQDGTACGKPGPRPFQGAAVGLPGNFVATVPGRDMRPRSQDAVQGLYDWLRLPQFALMSGQIPIADLLLGWVLMEGTAPDMARYPTLTWLRGYTNGADRPLSVTFDYPQPRACGRILYSSHHTRGHLVPGVLFPRYCPQDIIPQERVLEYLLFEVAACVPVLG